MALFSFRHSTKTFSVKVERKNRRARLGQTAAHLRYITRPQAARVVMHERLSSPSLNAAAKDAENAAAKRKGRVAERFIIALPLEPTSGQREALVRAFCEEMTKRKAGFVAAIHDVKGNDQKIYTPISFSSTHKNAVADGGDLEALSAWLANTL